MDHHQVQYPLDTVTVYDDNNNVVAVWSSDGYPLDPVSATPLKYYVKH